MNKEYSFDQKAKFDTLVESYKKLSAADLKDKATSNYSDTVHPGCDTQIGIRIFFDDEEASIIRVHLSLFIMNGPRKWWKLWDTPVLNEEIMIGPKGILVD